ncbi:hypothetical protein HJG60_010809 [Phyllostomus discolor]|uniref:Uncharacterized protein n=1 Tax=Phyllostomus discolor TaxID=89673 RepID=A0A834EAA3_9CHIR|nr:hypothetical protein HJG60_010809 [Phyllostomus discolor]
MGVWSRKDAENPRHTWIPRPGNHPAEAVFSPGESTLGEEGLWQEQERQMTDLEENGKLDCDATESLMHLAHALRSLKSLNFLVCPSTACRPICLINSRTYSHWNVLLPSTPTEKLPFTSGHPGCPARCGHQGLLELDVDLDQMSILNSFEDYYVVDNMKKQHK